MAFTDIERKNIKNRLINSCQKNWSKFGYRKTKVEELCIDAGISKGAFYKFYSSKEELFLDVMISIQSRFVSKIYSELYADITKKEFANLLKVVYREFVKIPFIFETQSPDFIAFINKLPNDKVKELTSRGSYDLHEIIKKTNLKYCVDEAIALSCLGFIFSPIAEEERKLLEKVGTIDFLIDLIVDNIFN